MPEYYVGIDPGPSTGIAILTFSDLEPTSWSVFQCDGYSATWLINQVYASFCPKIVAVEKFVHSNRPGNKGKDADMTRRIWEYAVSSAAGIRRQPPCLICERRAIDVKPWATDKRLAKTEFPWGAKFKDARDAGRHALFAAVHDGRERDPLL